jgi:hypothetical protein
MIKLSKINRFDDEVRDIYVSISEIESFTEHEFRLNYGGYQKGSFVVMKSGDKFPVTQRPNEIEELIDEKD